MAHDELAAARGALAREWALVRAWVDALPAGAYDRASVLDGWTVRDLAAHLGPGISVLSNAGDAEAGAVGLSHAAYVGQYGANAGAIAEGTRRVAAARADDLGAFLDDAWAGAEAWLDARGPDGRQLVQAKRGPIQLVQLVRTRLVEVVVHGDDLARSVPDVAAPEHDRDALREVVKLLLGVLAERAPGATVEVRVPPFAAIQCVEGGAHTRGTPPNTVEADPLTWIRVACGRVPWDELVVSGQLHVSGVRAADVATHLPLL